MNRRSLTWIVAIVAVLAIALAAWMYLAKPGLELYRTFESPDGNYRVEIWRQPQTSMMPGQSGDAPGFARLLDRSGKLLAEAPLDMVQLAEKVDWSDGHASIDLVVDWDLSAFPAP